MLAGLRALREWLLGRNRRSRYALGSSIPRYGRRVVVGVLRQDRGAPAWPSMALRPSRRPPRYGAKIDGALLEELVAANTGKNAIAFATSPSLATTLSLWRTGA